MELQYVIIKLAIEILGLLSYHWFADFVMQKGDWAVKKSSDFISLIKHTATYSLLWVIPMYIYCMVFDFSLLYALYFILITFVIHTATDYFTSKHSSKQYQKGNFGTDIPRGMDFFVTLGFDQLLHQWQLIPTFVAIFYFL